MNPKVEKVLNKINNEGIESVLPFFNDNFEKLLDYLKWGGAIEEFKLGDTDLTNDYYLYLINNGYEKKAMDEIIRGMGSLSYDGKDYYYELRYLDDMGEWFSTRGRDFSPRDIAEGVFKEDYWEPFYFYKGDINLMTEVYDDLTEENKKYVRDYIVDRYANVPFIIPSRRVNDMIERIGTESESSDYEGDYEITITQDNVLDLFSDDDIMNYLFQYDLSETGDYLTNIYTNSYNDAYRDEYYDKVWNELRGEFIDIDAEPIEFKFRDSYYTKLKVTDVLPRLIKQYVNNARCYDIDGLGDYSYLIREGIGCNAFEPLSFRISDYPSSTRVSENINEILKKYL
jgi:hypothetical protein